MQISLEALEATLPVVLGLQMAPVKTCKGWDELTKKVLAAEQSNTDQNESKWREIWWGIGESSEVVSAWVELIPNEYGLAIVKTGLALIFNVRNSPSFLWL